jgi:hypothetical protein
MNYRSNLPLLYFKMTMTNFNNEIVFMDTISLILSLKLVY